MASQILIDGDPMLYTSVAQDDPREAYKTFYRDISEQLFTSVKDTQLFISGKDNFRKEVVPGYKATRKPKPEGILELRQWVIDNMPRTVECVGHEADDGLFIYDQEQGTSSVIATVDKDLKTRKGRFFDFRKCELIIISEEEARRFMMEQFITGDSTDGVPGIRGMGAKKAAKWITAEDSLDTQWDAVKTCWQEMRSDDWQTGLNDTINGVFIRRRAEDLIYLPFADMSADDFREVYCDG